MVLKEFIKSLVEETKRGIVNLAKTELTNEEKKANLDEKIVVWVETAITKLPLKWYEKLVIKKVIIPAVTTITQIVFNLLKAKIDGITE